MKTCDVVIIGAGIICLSIAWQLRRRSNLRIVVCERGPGVGDLPLSLLRRRNTVADDLFRAEKLHLLQHRLRGLDLGATIRDYCGMYTLNQVDVHPVVGPWALSGFRVANGFSGHGFKLAPAIGALVARAISGNSGNSGNSSDFDCDLDLAYLAPDRTPLSSDSRSVLA